MSPSWDSTHCPEAPSSRDPRKGWLLPVPPPTCHHGPDSSKASISPVWRCRVPWRGQYPSHGTEPGDIEGQKPTQKPSPGPWGRAGGSPGAPQPESPGSRAHPGGTGDSDGDPTVSPSRPRPPHPPGHAAGPGVMGKAARNRDTARAIRACPLPQPPRRGDGHKPPQSGGKAQMPLRPPRPRRVPARTRCRSASGTGTGCPAASSRSGSPGGCGAAVPGGGGGSASRHRVMPSRSPLFSCLGCPSPMVPGTQSRIVPTTAPRGDARACSRPRATTPDPAATAGDSPGGHEPLPRGRCPINPPRLGVNDLGAVSVPGGRGPL